MHVPLARGAAVPRRRAWLFGVLSILPALVSACAAPPTTPRSITFATAVVWVVTDADSVRLSVEVAERLEQHELGLSVRDGLAPDAGMLFLFDAPRYGGDGFQMWRTRMPLDIAFIGQDGTILRILSMDPCGEPRAEDCRGYYPGLEYATALEVNGGWFAANDIEVGDVVRWYR